MIAYLIAAASATIITWLRWRFEKYKGDKGKQNLKHEFQNWFIGLLIGATVLSMITVAVSYGSYVRMRTTYDATVTQYKDAVEMYEDKAVLDIERAALVDFQYKGYQANISAFIVALREKVVEYNETYIGKKIMSKNILFWPMIIGPGDHLKPISIKSD